MEDATSSASCLAQKEVEFAELEKTQAPEDEARNWQCNAPLLYDFFLHVTLEWSALCVAWLPDVDGQLARFAFGTNEGGKKGELVVCEVQASAESYIEQNPWTTWTSDIGEVTGFGCCPCEGHDSPVARITRLQHPTEVNRVSPCLHRPQLLATKAASGTVLLYDYLRERDSAQHEPEPDVWLRPPSGSEIDGFALRWSYLSKGHLASGGNDGRCLVWDVNDASKASLLHNFLAHDGALCEVAFSHHESHLLATVGDDRALNVWDVRAPLGQQQKQNSVAQASSDEVLTVDWSYHAAHLLATAGKDHHVRVWDLRCLREPCKDLTGHEGACVAVRWCPQDSNSLASCSLDSTVIIWDLDPQREAEVSDEEDEEPSAPELLFKHAGHNCSISDFSWNPSDDNLLLSVDDGNCLQLWSPQKAFDADDGDHENDAACLHITQSKLDSSEGETTPLQKRPRLTSETGGEATGDAL